ncbi:hypothetical protein BH24ACT5_BH24ACT5_04740 [soil metagenome]
MTTPHERFDTRQRRITTSTLIAMLAAWSLLDLDDIDGTLPIWLSLVFPLLRRHRNDSARSAAAYYLEHRSDDASDALPFTPAVPEVSSIDARRMLRSLTATGPDRAAVALLRGDEQRRASSIGAAGSAATAIRLVLEGGRSTIHRAVDDDRAALGWQRWSTKPEPCAFCVMLISRGPVYLTEESATTAGFNGRAYHDGCMCRARPVFRADEPALPQAVQYRTLWAETTRGLYGQDALNALRRKLDETRKPAEPLAA